ncbi:Leucine-rich repeat receptor-like protein kinase PXL2 [Panicum miliaceum]|uniref:Leucine-rich repeat receptor-like protein kinase PXL2 n=1 Tax=Panicum miliaceum TaxID=4540 RepID=A0A3L6QVA1_PANMI|nr:Leucine-rich repeat receptor-like protein kinase PXL2 [Panicum miliaceum]
MEAPRRACAFAYPSLLGLLLLALPRCYLAQAQPADEARLLLRIKRTWGDPPVLAGWNASAAGAHCTWPYVGCDAAGRVASLTLATANVAGPFPDAAVGGLAGLTHLDVSNNSITGVFPAAMYRCSALQYLDVSQNYLGGELPADIGFRLGTNLTALILSGNGFNGTIPASLSGLGNLQHLKLDNNRLVGAIPTELGKMTRLQTLWLANNPFDAGELPASFKNLTNLTTFWARNCNLVGDFPRHVVDMPELEILDLSINMLTGSIPLGVWSLKKLQALTAFRNNLTGDLVVDDFAAMGLTMIDFSENNLTGVIPEVFGHLENLTYLYLFSNNFSGEIPASIGRLPSLSTLRLYSNRFTGTLPPELGKHSDLVYVEADDNELTGTIPEGLCARGKFWTLTASGNRLSGSIPEGLANCTTLRALHLESNQLSGEVPQALWTLTQISIVLLRNNRLTGRLPATMCSNLATLNIESNQFFGSIPATAAALQVFNAGNNRFSGKIPASLGDGMPLLQRLNLSDLGFGEASILRGLVEENLIGRGGSGLVYRVTYTNRFDGSAGAVAVKRIGIAGALDERLEREFKSEASILGSVRHNNIVRLLCCLSGTEVSLLVYDYMDNGSLDKWLHGDGLGGHLTARVRRPPLDWATRLRVAVGAAQGLCYMHHECSPPIVHRDVKTSNILLDSEFRAKVADFGLARVLARTGAPETMSAVAGSFGYMAPECGYTKKVSEKFDVYSFGVVLLELTTGKGASDGGEHGSLAEWARHHYRSGGSIPDATDRSIRYAGYSDEVEVVFRLGVLCTADLPSSRPAMKDVLEILLNCSEQTHQKSKTERGLEYEAAPLLLPQRGSRRKQLSNGTGFGIEERSDFDSVI